MAAPGHRDLNVKCYLRYQYCNIDHGNVTFLSSLSNGPYGSTIGVFQIEEDANGDESSYVRLIGTLDPRDSERINEVARPRIGGVARPRGGPRIGSRYCPDIEEVVVSQFSPTYSNRYPPNGGFIAGMPGAGGRKAYILLRVRCRV